MSLLQQSLPKWYVQVHVVNYVCKSAGLGRASHWKGHMQRHLAGLFSKRSANMQTYIYGTSALDATRGKLAQQVRSHIMALCYSLLYIHCVNLTVLSVLLSTYITVI